MGLVVQGSTSTSAVDLATSYSDDLLYIPSEEINGHLLEPHLGGFSVSDH